MTVSVPRCSRGRASRHIRMSNSLAVIASAAKQSRLPPRIQSGLLRRGACHRARPNGRDPLAPRNDEQHRFRGRIPPGFCVIAHPLNQEGAGNAGCWPHPRGLACKGKCTLRTQATSGSAEQLHSLRNGFNGLCSRSPRGAGLVSPRRFANRPRNLTPASGCRDHAT